MNNLKRYLEVVPGLEPSDTTLARPTLRHPDLQPNNVFVSDKLEITGVIDWQFCSVLPLSLQGSIPGSFQNYGDEVSESLQTPSLPGNFDNLGETEQLEQVLLLRKRQFHHHYVMQTRQHNPLHEGVLTDRSCTLQRKLFRHASDPWEGDSFDLQSDLLQLTKQWPLFDQSITGSCPVEFSADEAAETVWVAKGMEEADQQFQTCLDLVGAGPEGWVPTELYADVAERAQQLKADTIEEAETDLEKQQVIEHWIFDDFDEHEYS